MNRPKGPHLVNKAQGVAINHTLSHSTHRRSGQYCDVERVIERLGKSRVAREQGQKVHISRQSQARQTTPRTDVRVPEVIGKGGLMHTQGVWARQWPGAWMLEGLGQCAGAKSFLTPAQYVGGDSASHQRSVAATQVMNVDPKGHLDLRVVRGRVGPRRTLEGRVQGIKQWLEHEAKIGSTVERVLSPCTEACRAGSKRGSMGTWGWVRRATKSPAVRGRLRGACSPDSGNRVPMC